MIRLASVGAAGLPIYAWQALCAWFWRCLWVLTIASLLVLVYLKFSIKYDTMRIDKLLQQKAQIMVVHEQLLSKKERALSNTSMKRLAQQKCGMPMPDRTAIKHLNIS